MGHHDEQTKKVVGDVPAMLLRRLFLMLLVVSPCETKPRMEETPEEVLKAVLHSLHTPTGSLMAPTLHEIRAPAVDVVLEHLGLQEAFGAARRGHV